jgi:predicted unusual protein kinase regulating ubiquinone biosynthesis (AarF/ABC1/UbiB family)
MDGRPFTVIPRQSRPGRSRMTALAEEGGQWWSRARHASEQATRGRRRGWRQRDLPIRWGRRALPEWGQGGGVSELPRKAVTRTIKLATLPLGIAGRTTIGIGKRLGGRPAELVAAEIQQRTADQVFRVLGELKGGAMKFGQALSIFEAALPENLVSPYRATLTRLQEAAPPLPAATVHRVLANAMGPDWRDQFVAFDDSAAAAASIGQVHHAVWHDGREAAVKIQYPGAGDALLGDLAQIARLGRVFGAFMPGLDTKPLLGELRDRVAEELDYCLEGAAQQSFADAFDGDCDIVVPKVLARSDRVLVTEWIEGVPLSRIISHGDQDARDSAGRLFVRFLFSGPARAGLLHADPHPGNFRLMPDGRLGVLDFGAVNRLPGGLPEPIGRLLRIGLAGDADGLLAGLRAEGFVRETTRIDPDRLLAYLLPFVEPITVEEFRFSRAWLRRQAARVADPRSPAYPTGLQLNLPPSYLLIHRVWMGGVGVLCQLEANGHWRAELESLLPGLADPTGD